MFKEASNTLKIAVPLIISNVSQMALGLIDSAMIGAVDYRQLAAAALVLNVLTIPHVLLMGMTMAISPLVATANGRKDVFTASKVLYNGFVLCTLITLVIVLGIVCSKNVLFHIGQDPVVAAFAEKYYVIMALSLIPMIMFFAIKQFSDALEFTKTAMVLGLLSMPLNAFFNWIFIYGHWGAPRLELYGTGLSTFITRVIMMIVMILVVSKHRIFSDYIKARKDAWKIDLKTWKDLLHIGVPSSLQYSMEAGAFAVSGIMIGWLGATTQAAHQIALEIASLTFMASLGLSAAGSIRVANANGRNNKPLIRQIGISTMGTSLIYGLICAILFVAFRDSLPRIFNNNAIVVSIASTLLLWGALFQISDATQAVGVGLLRGIRDVKLPTAFVAIAYWVIGIPVGYYLAFEIEMGASGIWLGFVSGLTVSSILLNSRFLNKTKPTLQNFQH
ncbi:MAG TPA: MATE family efflux transporter [Segetibacter sp.]|jgi:MATE family multidrug resistance protein